MKSNKIIVSLFILIFALFISGCATSSRLVERPQLRDSSKSLVFLIRPSALFAGLRGVEVNVNKEKLANLANNSFTYFYAEAGTHLIETPEPTMLLGGPPSASIKVQIEAGKTYFLSYFMDIETGVGTTVIPIGNGIFVPATFNTPTANKAYWVSLTPERGESFIRNEKCSNPKILAPIKAISNTPLGSNLLPKGVAQTITSNAPLNGASSLNSNKQSELDMKSYYQRELKRDDLGEALRAHYEKKLIEVSGENSLKK